MSHCNPKTAEGSGNVFAYSKNAHRHNDSRICGAKTIVEGNQTVFVNGRLWAVKGDPNSHGNGRLINTGTTVFIQGIPVIVVFPDPAMPDNLCGGEGAGTSA